MISLRSFILILLVASAFAELQCGSRMCPDGNGCCNDVIMGPTCFSTTGAKCASTGITAIDGSMTTRLCGANDAACGTICYNPESYYCCSGQLLQNSEQCASQPTSAVTAAPNSAPTDAPTEAPTSAPTEAPTQAPTDAPTEAPTEAPTQAPTDAPTEAPTSSPTSPANNCLGYRGTTGVFCSEGEVCCGAGGIYPSCLPANGTKQCCTWFLAATQCDIDEVCGGGLGPGASSYAQCGAPGTQFCNYGTGSNTFCAQNQTCCGQYGSYATCCDNEPVVTDAPVVTEAPIETEAPTVASETTAAPILNNCPGAARTAGVNCSETETCCGAGTMTPSCLPADGSKQCCTWYLSSTQCNPDEVCGGDLGYGASSYARCGPAGTTFCNKGDGMNAFCAEDSPLCCGNYGQLAFCCKENCACPTDGSFACVC